MSKQQTGFTFRQARRLIELHERAAQIYQDAGQAEAAGIYRKVAHDLQRALPRGLRRWHPAA